MKKIFYLVILLSAGLIASCSKGKKITPVKTDTTKTTTPTTLDLIRDSVYLYAKEDYLWYDQLPTYATFNPRSFTGVDDIHAMQTELDALSQYAKNPATNKPYEDYGDGTAKYSFIDDGTESGSLNGVNGDFGFQVGYEDIDDLRVIFVYPGSPADIAGLKRGYRITSINNRTKLSYDAQGYGDGSYNDLNFVDDAIRNSSTIKLVMTKPDNSTLTKSFGTANYNVNPVLKDTVYDTGNGHKLGYIVFNSFTSDAVADPKLNAAFADFASKGVTDLAVDLRYNGGGYVSTAEHLDNLIVPAAKSGSLMYNTFYNSNLVSGKDPLLKKQVRKDPSSGQLYNYGQFDYSVSGNAVNFAKTGTLNVNRVFFIITGHTASASELTINNLRPEMDVQFVGSTSYGKPVGFFDIDINKYIMFTPEFSTQNSANQGGYYAGFTPNTAGYPGVHSADDYTKEFGDPTEGLLAHIISYVKTGSYTVKTPVIQSTRTGSSFSIDQRNLAAKQMDKHRFQGMIFNRKNLKLKK